MNPAFARKLLLLAAQFNVACDSAKHFIISRLEITGEDILMKVGDDAYNVLYGIVANVGHIPRFGSSVIYNLVVDSAENALASGGSTLDATHAIWKTIWSHHDELNKEISPLLSIMNDVNPFNIMGRLCAVNLTEMTHITRCFYLWSLYD